MKNPYPEIQTFLTNERYLKIDTSPKMRNLTNIKES